MPEGTTRYRVSEDAPRSYDPLLMAGGEDNIEFVRLYIKANGPCRQTEIRLAVAASIANTFNGACAITSAALLTLRERGKIRCARPNSGARPAIWEEAT